MVNWVNYYEDAFTIAVYDIAHHIYAGLQSKLFFPNMREAYWGAHDFL